MASSRRLYGPRQEAGRPQNGLAKVRVRGAGPLLAAGLAVLAGLAVVGCGSVTAGASGSGSAASASRTGSGRPSRSGSGGAGQDISGTKLLTGPALCAHPGRARRVMVTRTGGVRILEGGQPAQPAGSLPPASGSRPVMIRTITQPGVVQGLARALCALPRMPRGPLPCPALFPGSYQLYFTADGLRLPVVVVEESGCREVTGLGPVRRADKASFWRLLGHIVGADRLPPGSIQPGGPAGPGSGLLTGCEPVAGQQARACPYQSGLPHKPWS